VRRRDELVIPAKLSEEEIASYLGDLFHEVSIIGARVKRID
jgi:hypothetical protein